MTSLDISGILLFSIVAGVIILALIYINRVGLHLSITKILHGSNSTNYFKLLNKYFGELPFPEAIKFDPVYFMQSFLKKNSIPVYNSSIPVTFNEIDPGSIQNGFLKKFGNPNYVTIKEKDVEGIEIFIFGFKRKIYDYNGALLYFFAGNLFLMGQYIFKREKQKVFPEKITKILSEIYLKGNTINEKKYIIKGSNNTLISVEDDGFALTMTYFNPEKKIIRNILTNGIDSEFIREADVVEADNETLTF